MFKFIKFWYRYNINKPYEQWSVLFTVVFTLGIPIVICLIFFTSMTQTYRKRREKLSSFWTEWKKFKSEEHD